MASEEEKMSLDERLTKLEDQTQQLLQLVTQLWQNQVAEKEKATTSTEILGGGGGGTPAVTADDMGPRGSPGMAGDWTGSRATGREGATAEGKMTSESEKETGAAARERVPGERVAPVANPMADADSSTAATVAGAACVANRVSGKATAAGTGSVANHATGAPATASVGAGWRRSPSPGEVQRKKKKERKEREKKRSCGRRRRRRKRRRREEEGKLRKKKKKKKKEKRRRREVAEEEKKP